MVQCVDVGCFDWQGGVVYVGLGQFGDYVDFGKYLFVVEYWYVEVVFEVFGIDFYF